MKKANCNLDQFSSLTTESLSKIKGGIPAKKVAKFKAGKVLADAVKGD